MPPSMNKGSDVEDPSDAVAEAQAAQAREEGTDMIREHLRGHLDQNPESNYVTWIATLHPENATVLIDPRFLTPGNPWKTVYEETRYEVYGAPRRRNDDAVVVGMPVDSVTITQHEQRSFGGFIDLMVFSMIAFTAVTMTFATEIVTLTFRAVGNVFECLTDACSRHVLSKYSLGVIFWIMWKSFWFTEMLTLYLSVFLVEFLAGLSLVFCSLFSLDCNIGRVAHQRTRRVAHLTRWACRRPFGAAAAPTTNTTSASSSDIPEHVQEIRPTGQEDKMVAHVPTATAVHDGANTDTVQTATVVAIQDDEKADKGAV